MRWKLLIITSLVAALTNAGGMHALAYWMTGTTTTPPTPAHPGALAGVMIIPLVFTTLACIFVYRHTARRRKLQAALTAVFALVLSSVFIIVSRLIF